MASNTAYLALFVWPIVVVYLFRARPLNEALVWSVIGGYLLLPQYSAFDPPMLPPWDKNLVPSLFAAIMCFVVLKKRQKDRIEQSLPHQPGRYPKTFTGTGIDDFMVRRGKVLFWGLVVLLFGSSFITTLTNSERLVEEFRVVEGMRLYDALSMGLKLLVSTVPFFLARRFLSSPESHVVLLKTVALCCLGYSLLALWEVRMSPQLHSQIYGFFPHRWGQHARYGGYRPVVFLNHGLWVAIMMAMGALATMALWRVRLKQVSRSATIWILSSFWMLGVVVLCKSAGAILITLVLLPVVFFSTVRLQMLFVATLIGIILVYPSLRGADYVPVNKVYSTLAKVDAERARSLQIRFEAEDVLLAHANAKPLAGWGSWGRNRVQNEKGGSAAATDGYWVIIVGVYGWLGYIAQFGLLGISTILLAMNSKRFKLGPATSGLAVVLCAALVDLIPNATISPVVWLIAGAMMGRYQTALVAEKSANIRAERSGAVTERTSKKEDIAVAREVRTMDTARPHHVRKPREGY